MALAMASCSTRDPRSFSISDVLFKFKSAIGGEALSALEARDDVWRSENEALRAECRILDADMRELLSQSRWLEEEIGKFEDKERWLLERIRRLEEDVCKVETEKREEVGAVLSEKALLQANIEGLLRRLAKVESKEKERIANEKRRSEEEKIVRISGFARRIEVLEREKREMEKKIALEAEKGRTEKMALEAEKRRTEKEKEEKEKKVSELIQKIEVLEMEKGEMDAEVCKLREKSRGMEKVLNEKMSLEAEKRRLEEENEKISELVQRVGVLERKKGDIEAECCKIKWEKSTEIERILHEKLALEAQKRIMEEEMKEKISELGQRVGVLEREKIDIEAECCKIKREKSTEFERILDEKIDLEAQKRRMEEEVERISELVHRIGVLEREKEEIEDTEIKRFLKQKIALETQKRRMEEEQKEKISELVQRIGVLEREKREMEAEFCKTRREKSTEIERVLDEKMALEAQKRRMEEEFKQKISELVQRIEVLERENKTMEAEVSNAKREKNRGVWKILNVQMALEAEKRRVEEEKEQISELVKRIGVLEREKVQMEAEVSKAKKDKSNEAQWISKVKMAIVGLEARKRSMEETKKKIIELGKGIGALERAKEAMEAKVLKVNREKSEEINRILNEKMAVEAEKRTTEEEDKKKVLELLQRIEVLEREKRKMEAEFCQANREKSVAIRIVNEKMAAEAERRTMKEEDDKKVLELAQRIDILEREKRQLETEIMVKDELIKVLGEENSCLAAMKVKLEMEINGRVSTSQEDVQFSQQVHLAGNVGVFGACGQNEGKKSASVAHPNKQKRSLNYDVTENSHEDGITRANARKRKQPNRSSDVDDLDKDSSFAKCKKPAKEIHKPSKSTGVTQWRKLVPHKEKKETKSAGCTNRSNMYVINPFAKCEKPAKEILKPSKSTGVTQRRKLVPRKEKKETKSAGCTNQSNVDVVLADRENVAYCQSRNTKAWEVHQDLLDAFDSDRELCLKAICALYRQHMLVANSRNTSLLSGDRGFKPEYASKAIPLAEFLTHEDPGGRMKKTVAELDQLDPKAVDECLDIAKQHYKQVFEIYQKKVDPLFLP